MSSLNWTTDFLNQLNNPEFFIVPTVLRRNTATAARSHGDQKRDKTVLWQIESKHWQQFRKSKEN